MFRQLLQTECKPALRLSRLYEGTPSQLYVLSLPLWEPDIVATKRMVISYDSLSRRLWDGAHSLTLPTSAPLPPFAVPSPTWPSLLGFQTPDPLTDYRSGGILSLALLVSLLETRPSVFLAFAAKPALPFAMCGINVTTTLARILMLSPDIESAGEASGKTLAVRPRKASRGATGRRGIYGRREARCEQNARPSAQGEKLCDWLGLREQRLSSATFKCRF